MTDINPYLKRARSKYTEYASSPYATTKSIVATIITLLLLVSSIFILPIFILLLVIIIIFAMYKLVFTKSSIKEHRYDDKV